MKVNVFGMLFNLVALFAVFNFAFLSAAEIPISDEQKSAEIKSTLSSLEASSKANETVVMSQSVESTSSNSSENASVEGSSPSDTLPPLVFPAEEDKFLPKNDTALKILQEVSGKPLEDSKSNETEVNSSTPVATSSEFSTNTTADSTTTTKETPEDDYDSISEEGGNPEAENVQDKIDEKQEELEEEFGRNGSDKATIHLFEDPVTNEPALHNGHVALIFASTLVVLSVVAYIGLILWRSRLESRYGMRQRLVTNDDYYNNNDVRYFGL